MFGSIGFSSYHFWNWFQVLFWWWMDFHIALFIFITKPKLPRLSRFELLHLIGPTSIIIANQEIQYAQASIFVLSLIGCLLALCIHRVGTDGITLSLSPSSYGGCCGALLISSRELRFNGGSICANLMTGFYLRRLKNSLLVFHPL